MPYQTLHDSLAVLGAQMLLHAIQNRLYIKPYRAIQSPYPPSAAPKIDQEVHAKISWDTQTAEEVQRYSGVLGTVWCRVGPVEYADRRKRAILTDLTHWGDEKVITDEPAEPGQWRYHLTGYKKGVLLIKCRVGWIEVGGIKIEGKGVTHAGEWARSMAANQRGPWKFS